MKTFVIVLIVLGVLAVIGVILFIILKRKSQASCQTLCNDQCYDTNKYDCVNGALVSKCPTNQIRCPDGKCYNATEMTLCQGKCYDSSKYTCKNGNLLKFCGSNICKFGENCMPDGSCVPMCLEETAICGPNNSSGQFCYYVGQQSQSFKLFYGQRFYSADYRYYACLEADKLSIFNNSDQRLNIIVQYGAQSSPQDLSAYFDKANVVILNKDTAVASLIATPTAGTSATYEILNAKLVIIGNENVAIGLDDTSALIMNKVGKFAVVNYWLDPNPRSLKEFIAGNVPNVGNTNIPACFYLSIPGIDNVYLFPGSYMIANVYTLSKETLLDPNIYKDSNGYVVEAKDISTVRIVPVGDQGTFLQLTGLRVIYDHCAKNNYPTRVRDVLFYYYLEINGRSYPYLVAQDLDPVIPLEGFYKTLVTAWCKYYNTTFMDQCQTDRFGLRNVVSGDCTGNTKQVRDYNINTRDGRTFCVGNDSTKQFCLEIMTELCYTNPKDRTAQVTGDNVFGALKTYNLHPECDTCRALYMYKNLYPDESDVKANIINKMLAPYCSHLSSKFVSPEYRQCCADNNTEECKHINSLFTKNGNCSCFMNGNDLLTLFDSAEVAQKAGMGLKPDCYSDCINNSIYYTDNAYDPNNCQSTFCIIDQKDSFNINNTNIGTIAEKNIASCNIKTKP